MWALLLLALQTANPHTTPVDVAEGKEVFRLRCAECHGASGEGGRAPNLADGVFYHGGTDADLYNTIENGITGTEMPGFSGSELRLWQLVAFIRSLRRDVPAELPGDPARGEAIFREKGGCLACHRVGREGGFAAPDLTAVGLRRSLDYLRTSILDPSRDVRPRYRVATLTSASSPPASGFLLDEDRHTVQLLDFDGKLLSLKKKDFTSFDVDRASIMQSYEGVLDDAEIDDVVSYLATLRGEAGR